MDWERWMMWAAGLLLAGTSVGALIVHPGRPRRVVWPVLLGAIMGGVPVAGAMPGLGALPGSLFLTAVAIVCAAGALLGTAGAWMARLRPARCRRPILSFLGTILGAVIGSPLCAATVWAAMLLDGDVASSALIAAGLVGSFATFGYQLGAGGASPAPQG